jgi:hypothetical protein
MKIISVKSAMNGKMYYVERLDEKTSRKQYNGDEFAYVYHKKDATRFDAGEIEYILRRLNFECAADVEIKVLEEPFSFKIVAKAS